ncbi:unnamed protein product [Chrysoparadoxa australica]
MKSRGLLAALAYVGLIASSHAAPPLMSKTVHREALTTARLPYIRGGAIETSAAKKAELVGYFGAWYVANIGYNIVNKKVLNKLPLPWSVATTQLMVGGVWAVLLWALRLRTAPSLTGSELKDLVPLALFHGGGQLATVTSLGAGAVSFTHIVKAMEPMFSAAVACVCFGQVFKPQVYATLLPIVGGVSLACYTELDFSVVSFCAAMASNLFFACRANFSKMLLSKPRATKLSAANLYAAITIASFTIFSPLALLWEASGIKGALI